jgi:hypothetical protein
MKFFATCLTLIYFIVNFFMMLFLFDRAEDLLTTILIIAVIYWSILVWTEKIMSFILVSDKIYFKKIIFLLYISIFTTGFVYYFVIARNLETKNKYFIAFTPLIFLFGIYCAIKLLIILFKYFINIHKNKK